MRMNGYPGMPPPPGNVPPDYANGSAPAVVETPTVVTVTPGAPQVVYPYTGQTQPRRY